MFIEFSQHLRISLFWYYFKTWPLCNFTRDSMLVAMGVPYLPLDLIIIVIIFIIIVINIIFIIFVIRDFVKNCFYSYEVSWPFWFSLFLFLYVLTWFTQPPFNADALPQYYHLLSFNYGDMKERDIDQVVADFWAILSYSIFGDNWEVGESLAFLFFLFVKGSWHFVWQ